MCWSCMILERAAAVSATAKHYNHRLVATGWTVEEYSLPPELQFFFAVPLLSFVNVGRIVRELHCYYSFTPKMQWQIT